MQSQEQHEACIKAARVSADNRRRRAIEAKERAARRARALTPGHHEACRCDQCLDAMVQFIPTGETDA
jgi:hypothetical protein